MNATGLLLPGEQLHDLLVQGLKIIQSPDVFCFSLDAVLLARFASVPPRGRVLDLCAGNGVVPLLLATRTKARIDAVELQPRLADMARRSVKLNGLDEQIRVLEADLRTFAPVGGIGYDAVTVNPPYQPADGGERKENPHQALARYEIGCTLEDVVAACARSVKPGGRVAMVHRPARLAEIFAAMHRHRLEPKKLRFVHPKREAEANMVLIEAMRDGRPGGIRLLPPLIAHEEDGRYTDELMDIFYGRKSALNGTEPMEPPDPAAAEAADAETDGDAAGDAGRASAGRGEAGNDRSGEGGGTKRSVRRKDGEDA
jgi:tRNA1(Val) A37 N6-methylase TrmN6